MNASTLSNKRMSLALAQEAVLGEGLVWHIPSQSWWWTDIESSTIHAWRGDNEPLCNYRLPDRVGSLAHCESGRILLGMTKRLCIANESDVAPPASSSTLTSGATGSPILSRHLHVQSLVAVDAAEPRTRINDGRTDRSGNFVFGTINESAEKRLIGSFYQYSTRHGLRRLALPAVAIANSICFSPDGTTMYFTDTLTRRILQCDYDAASARVSNVRHFVEVSDADGAPAYPDGSVIDRHGCLWNAQWGAAQIVQYDPSGKVMQRYSVPTKNPTCPAFGGPNLDILMVTTSRQDMTPQEHQQMPLAGSLFSIQLPQATGLPDALFHDLSHAPSAPGGKAKLLEKAALIKGH